MSLRIYNTRSRALEDFSPIEPGHVRMYVCGITVYDRCHVGHARANVAFDVVQRWLKASGYKLNFVRNITDIDDKIIRRAVENGETVRSLTDRMIAEMYRDFDDLGIERPTHEPRATDYVPQMLGMVKKLEDKGLAYRTESGDVNYAVRSFPGYGKLSGKTLDDLRAGERVAVAAGKRDPLDFVLWKSAKPTEPEETKWESPYGFGRPGWHIECSAMSRAILGLPLDIHGGGPDLKFPHHENEIAQTEGAFGGTLANTWMHCGPLMVDSEKMSKSLGNFSTIRQTIAVDEDAASQSAAYDYNAREAEMLRFFIVRNHYRSLQNYAPDNLFDAQNALDRLYQTLQNVPPEPVEIDWSEPAPAAFRAAMNDDFNTSGAVAALFELASIANREGSGKASGLMRALGALLGLLQTEPAAYLRSATRYQREAVQILQPLGNDEIEALIQQRAAAKAQKDFSSADAIRATLSEKGVTLEDKPGGLTQWRRN